MSLVVSCDKEEGNLLSLGLGLHWPLCQDHTMVIVWEVDSDLDHKGPDIMTTVGPHDSHSGHMSPLVSTSPTSPQHSDKNVSIMDVSDDKSDQSDLEATGDDDACISGSESESFPNENDPVVLPNALGVLELEPARLGGPGPDSQITLWASDMSDIAKDIINDDTFDRPMSPSTPPPLAKPEELSPSASKSHDSPSQSEPKPLTACWDAMPLTPPRIAKKREFSPRWRHLHHWLQSPVVKRRRPEQFSHSPHWEHMDMNDL